VPLPAQELAVAVREYIGDEITKAYIDIKGKACK